jgi:hypothetical protein
MKREEKRRRGAGKETAGKISTQSSQRLEHRGHGEIVAG